MLRAVLPVGIFLFAGIAVQPVEAANCPAGQFYRVSLKACQSKAVAIKQIKGGKPTAARKTAKAERETIVEKTTEESAKPARNVRSAKVMLPPPRPSSLDDDDVETTRGYTPDPADARLRGAIGNNGKSNALPAAATSFSPYGALSPFGAR